MLRVCLLIICLAWFMFLPSRAIREKCVFTILRFNHLQSAVKSQSISVMDGLSVVMKMWVFPFFLIIYLIYLFIDQTHVFNFHFHYLFLIIDASWLLWMLIVSGIVSVFTDQEKIQNRTGQYTSPLLGRTYLVCCGFLGMLSFYIIYNLIVNMTPHAYSIATIAGIALVLTGFLLVKEQEQF